MRAMKTKKYRLEFTNKRHEEVVVRVRDFYSLKEARRYAHAVIANGELFDSEHCKISLV